MRSPLLHIAAVLLGCGSLVQAQTGTDNHRAVDSARVLIAVSDTSTQVTRVIRAFLDNDLFALRGQGAATDYDYTNGVGATAYWADAPAWLRRRVGDRPGCAPARARETACVRGSLGIRQLIYTPASNSAVDIPGQRLHAGFLGVSVGAALVSPRRVRELQLEVGTTGPPAMAAPVQGAIHEFTGTERELGWHNQIEARPMIAARYNELWQFDARPLGAHVRSRIDAGAQLGTMRVALESGAEVRVSIDRRRFWTPYDGGPALPLGPFLLTGVRQEWVGRDVFLDGVAGGRPSTAERRSAVWQTMVGVGWRFAGGATEYRHVRRGREYAGQLGPHAYGALVFTFYKL